MARKPKRKRGDSPVTNMTTRVLRKREGDQAFAALDVEFAHFKKRRKGKLLLGWGFPNDVSSLRISKDMSSGQLDLQNLPYFARRGPATQPWGLKEVTKKHLGRAIQTGSKIHSAKEDATAVLDLYKAYLNNLEQIHPRLLQRRAQLNSHHDSEAEVEAKGEDQGSSEDERQDKANAEAALFGRHSRDALQGLLRKLGAGFEDILPSGGASGARLKSILVQLRQDDEIQQLDGLGQLCELLSVSTEESLSVVPVESLVPVLVNLLNVEHNSDIMLLAARALTFMADVMPSSCSSIVRCNAVPAFCARLLSIEYMDLAEQSLQALEKLAHEHPQACLNSGGLMAVLTYLDFFQTGVQRVAVATAAAMTRGIPRDATDTVVNAIPLLTPLLEYKDTKVVESTCLALSRIAEALSQSPEHVDTLSKSGLINSALHLISVSEGGSLTSQLSVSTYFGLVKLLTTCVISSAAVAETLLENGISGTLHSLLQSSSLFASATSSPGSILRSSDQLYEVVTLACELLPPLPNASLPAPAHELFNIPRTGVSAAVRERNAASVATREAFLQAHPEAMASFCSDLLPTLLTVHGATVNAQVKTRCLATVTKMVHYASSDMLRKLLKDVTISSFIASLLSTREGTTNATAVRLAELLMDKLPEIYTKYFLKEGVVHAMEQLALSAPAPPAPAPAPAPAPVPAAAEASSVPEASAPEASQPAPKKETRSSTRLRSSKSKGEGHKKGSGRHGSSPPAGASPPPPAAPSPSREPALPPKTPLPPSLRDTAALRARSFKEQYFSGANQKSAEDTDDARKLREVCERLRDPGAVKQLLNIIQGSDSVSVSTFEFLSSGAVGQLKAYLTGADLQGPTRRQSSHLVPSSGAMRYAGGLGGGSGLSVLGPASDASALTFGLAALSQPFQLRLARAAHERQLGDYGCNTVLIEPLATMFAVEDFLWPRVYRKAPASPAPKERHRGRDGDKPSAEAGDKAGGKSPGAHSKPAAAAAAAGASNAQAGKGQQPAQKGSEDAPPQTRTRGRRSAAQPIPGGRTTANQRMTRAQAARAAAELQEEAAAHLSEATGPSEGAKPPQNQRGSTATGRARGASSSDAMEDEDLLLMTGVGSLASEEDMPQAPAAPRIDTAHLTSELASEEDMAEDDMDHDQEDEDEDEDEMDMDEDEDEEVEADLPAAEHMSVGSMEVHDMLLGEGGLGSGVPGTSSSPAPPGPVSSSERPVNPSDRATYAQAARTSAAGDAGQASTSGGDPLAPRGPNDPPRLHFFFTGRQVKGTSTIFQAVQPSQGGASGAAGGTSQGGGGGSEREAPVRRRRLWDEVHTLHYCRAENPAPAPLPSSLPPLSPTESAAALAAAAGPPLPANSSAAESSPLSELTDIVLSPGIQANQPVLDLLLLLKLLNSLGRMGDHLAAHLSMCAGRVDRCIVPCDLAPDAFISTKLASKLAQQLKDVLAICGSALPPWNHALATSCKFLFPFELRRRLFYCTSFGLARALQHLQQQQAIEGGQAPASHSSRDGGEIRLGRLPRQKVRVSRQRILDSAAKVMELYASNRAVLELEYFGEVGTGLGPSLEFYTLLSHELQKKGLGMWRADTSSGSATKPIGRGEPRIEGAAIWPAPRVLRQGSAGDVTTKPDQYLVAPQGLFPAPLPPSQIASKGQVLDRFKLLGRAMAKVLQDTRLLDLPVCYVFFRIALGQSVDLYDVRKVDEGLGASLEKLKAAHTAWKLQGKLQAPLYIDGSLIEDLCLTFVLPGCPEYELRPGGTDVVVDASNVGEYVDAVVDALLRSGIQHQMTAFREGFGEVFPLECLKCFHEEEIEVLLCGTCERWTVSMLADTIKFDHGYTSSSTAVQHFLETLAELDSADQRRFLRFVTGCPSLPPGGVAALQPRLTVVRKQSSSAMEAPSTPRHDSASGTPRSLSHTASMGSADGDLPSVMTCANYIKLPPYSTKAVMQERLLFVIREGQCSFDLS
ncbi:hypothetical protein WJX73_009807 [Symbiochloris irregularis]|uniref:HECT-type E3 ubiquitin transferase n=1 Tax=Symbiochloris irregularis TaxID=706552 RepID=A0AAW1NYS6_9CHLO